MMSQVVSPVVAAEASKKTKRVTRSPQHTFSLKTKPFAIQPFMIAPMLAGETLVKLNLQARVITDPVLNPITGWWKEYYFFHVKMSQLPNFEAIKTMLLDPSDTTLEANDTASAFRYHNGQDIDFLADAYQVIVDKYFRAQSDIGNVSNFTLGQAPAAINMQNWTESLFAEEELPDLTVDQTPTADISIEQLNALYETWLTMTQASLTNMTYEDYLATFGVNSNADAENRPELIRYFREWSYPTNTVNPSDILDGSDEVVVPAGQPTSAVSWAINGSADKKRFADEPGFIVGVTVTRPKVYFENQLQTAVSMLTRARYWMPMTDMNNPMMSIRKYAQATGPLSGEFTTRDYTVDVRDLFVYGDQFVNHAPTQSADFPAVALPKSDALASVKSKYPVEADVDALFVDPTTFHNVREDGIVSLTILGHQVDNT